MSDDTPTHRRSNNLSSPAGGGGAISVQNQDLIDAWLEWKASGETSPGTIRQRRYIIQAFAREHDLLTASLDDITAWIAQPSRGPCGKKSVRSTLTGFYRWAVAAGHINTDPTSLTHPIREPKHLPKPVPELVLERALARADEETRFMLILGAWHGLRCMEIASLHSDWVTDMGLFVTGKGKRQRRVPIHPRLVPYLDFTGWAFPSPVRPGEHVGVSYVADRVCTALGGGWTTHSLRHRAATQWYRATHDLRAVQTLLGHSSPTTTARYILLDDDALAATIRSVA